MYNYYNKYFISKEADKMLYNSSDSKQQAMYEAIKLAKQKVNKNTLDNLRDMSIGELRFVPKK